MEGDVQQQIQDQKNSRCIWGGLGEQRHRRERARNHWYSKEKENEHSTSLKFR